MGLPNLNVFKRGFVCLYLPYHRIFDDRKIEHKRFIDFLGSWLLVVVDEVFVVKAIDAQVEGLIDKIVAIGIHVSTNRVPGAPICAVVKVVIGEQLLQQVFDVGIVLCVINIIAG